MIKKRGSGILLHITSLPSPFGIGDFGPAAYKFADFLSQSKQSYWQVLPLNPIELAFGCSPYSSFSAFAGNILLIGLELLVEEGLLSGNEFKEKPVFAPGTCQYNQVVPYKLGLYDLAYQHFKSSRRGKADYDGFCSLNANWLEDFSLFVVIKRHSKNKSWVDWTKELRDSEPSALRAFRRQHAQEVEKEKFLQYLFFKQWHLLKDYCHSKGVQLIGDIPIYVGHDSADVWANPRIFKLQENKHPLFVAGVPPDYFSATGQLWGNPVYDWEVLKNSGYKWWLERFEHNLSLFDIVRVDHFRGFVAYWQVPAGELTAINGSWVRAPALDFFTVLTRKYPDLRLIAEDLGIITDDVREIMANFGFPGMRLLLFAFGEDNPKHPYLPHNYPKNCVIYTGTHDNNTVRGWFENEAGPAEKERLMKYLGCELTADNVSWELIRLAAESVANTVVFPIQDVLGLGEEARMNMPGRAEGNWSWRLLADQINPTVTDKLLEITKITGRA